MNSPSSREMPLEAYLWSNAIAARLSSLRNMLA